MTWKHLLAGICGFTFGFWLCMPRAVVWLPRYEVLVVDANGVPFPGSEVRQVREDIAAASSTIATADSYGRAAFPSVHGRPSPLLRLFACERQMATHGIHAPCAYRQQIAAEIPGFVEASRTESDLPLKGRGRLLRITMRPADTTP